MFVDIKSSTSIAEKIGHKKFLSLVNDFFNDLSVPVSQTRGDIYKYVGDGAIISWKMKDAMKDANCLRCFKGIQERIEKNRHSYLANYGLIPEFKAGLHGGTVITGELGYTRREIAFMGDVMNTTARIEEACNTYEANLLVSEFLWKHLSGSGEFSARKVGNVILRGKSEEVGLMMVEAL
jgi:adenylate cyclase